LLEVPKKIIDKNVVLTLENQKNDFLSSNVNESLIKYNTDEDWINELVGKKRSFEQNGLILFSVF
jgi:hypothetical protein